MRKIFLYIIFLLLVVLSNKANATHVAGAEMSYTSQIISESGGVFTIRFDFTLKIYRDCGGVNLADSASIYYDFGYVNGVKPASNLPNYVVQNIPNTAGVGNRIKLTRQNISEVQLACGTQTTNCAGGAITGYQEHIYTGSRTLTISNSNFGTTLGNAETIRFYFNNFARNNTISNVTGAGGYSLYNEVLFNFKRAVYEYLDPFSTVGTSISVNNSPTVAQQPVFYACAGDEINFSNIASDIQGDNIEYRLVNPQQTGIGTGSFVMPPGEAYSTNVPFNGGFTMNNPMPTASGFNLNPTTGQLTFTPTTPGAYIFSILIIEKSTADTGAGYAVSGGTVKSTIMRDYQFNIQNCPPAAVTPNASGPNFDTTSYLFESCYTEPFCFDIVGFGTGTDTNFFRYNNEIDTAGNPSNSFTITKINGDSTVARFCWDPGSFIGVRTFTVTSELDLCPYKRYGTFTYTIYIDTNYSAVCTDTTVYLDASGQVTIDSSYVWDTAVSNPCEIATISIDNNQFFCPDTGVNIVTMTAQFSNGLQRICTSNVTVLDTIKPVIVCQAATLYLDTNGNLVVDTTGVINSVTDNCGIDSVWVKVTDTLFGCVDTGVSTITVYAMDYSGNMDSCTATVTIVDTIIPTIACLSPTLYLDATGSLIIDTTGLIASVSDNCTIDSVWINDSDTLYGCTDTGTHNVTIYVRDASGYIDSCISTITVLDTIAPSIVCLPATLYLNATGSLIIDTTGLISSTSDNCSVDSVWVKPSDTSFSCANVGMYMVTIYASDPSGNMDSCLSSLTILDTVNPLVICKDTTIYLDATGNYTIDSSYINNGSSDACGIQSITLSRYTFACVDTGNNTVTMYVTDVNGNIDSCLANVLVIDSVPPIVLCKDTTIYLNAAGTFTIDSSYIDNGSYDACGIFTISQSTFTCSDLGANNVTLYVSDGTNIDSCSAIVTVLDTIVPTISCLPATFYLDNTGQIIIDTTGLVASTNDNCGVDSVWVKTTDTLINCAQVGTFNATIYVSDASGNIDSCISILTIVDTVVPVVICKDTLIYLDTNGFFTIDSSYIDNGSTDACGIQSITLSQYVFACTDTGVNVVTMYVTDVNGNIDSCLANVNVQDTLGPIALCKDTTIYLDATGNFTIDSSYVDNGSNDPCGIFLISQSDFNCSHLGPNNVTLYVYDLNSNVDSCTSIVTVLDTIAPTISCLPATYYLDASGLLTIDTTGLISSLGDNCTVDSVWINPNDTSYGCIDTGVHTITLYVMDGSGNMDSCVSTITVLDTIAPTISCLPATYYIDASGLLTIDTTGLISSLGDNCTVDSVWINPNDTNYACIDTGVHTITLYVMDGSGNMDSCVSTITVLDTIAPTISCLPATYYIDASGLLTIDTTGLISSLGDNCTVDSVWMNASDTSYGCVDTGVHTITLYIMDGSGNMDSCVSTITVLDTIAPTISCLPATYYLDASGLLTIDTTGLISSLGDNCTVDSVWINPNDTNYACIDTGIHTITLYVMDGSGNMDSCVSTITVLDTVKPIVICIDTTIYLDSSGVFIIDSSFINNGSNDACGIVSMVLSNNTFNCTDTGINLITLIVSDASGNVDSCTANVTVVDTIGPIAICLDTTIYLDATGNFTIDSSFVDGGSNDPCGIYILSKSSFTCNDVGPNNVTLYVYDLNNNVDSCIAIVTVLDTINPTVACQNVTIYLDATGQFVIDSSYIDNGSADACGIQSIVLSQTVYTCGDTGINSVVMYVTDNNGNIDSCVAQVTVVDTIIPIINAGSDDSLCAIYTYTLNGNAPTGTLVGTWNVISSPNAPVFGNINQYNSSLTGLIEGTYVLEWSITNGVGCNISRDTMRLFVYDLPVSDAGRDTSLCNQFSLGLNGNVLTGLASGTWTYLTPSPTVPSFTNPNNPNTVVSNLDEGTYRFVWTVSNGSCLQAIDTVTVNVYELPVANAGNNIDQCGRQDALLIGNTPAGTATGLWSIDPTAPNPNTPVFTNATSPITTITNLVEGTYTLVWTVSNGTCVDATDTITLRVSDPVTSNAGVDTNLCATYSLQLYGNAPVGTATGFWYIDTANSTFTGTPVLADSSQYNTTLSGLNEGRYKLLWILQNGSCAFSADSIIINVWDNPVNFAGNDTSLCAIYSINLYATPISGTSQGLWMMDTSYSSPNTPILSNPTSPGTAFSGMVEGSYRLIWRVTNGPCYDYRDTVVINVFDQPIADASPTVQDLCNQFGATISAVPLTGSATGTWHLASSTPNTPTFDANATTTLVTPLQEAGTYVFYYEAINGVCPISRDTVTIYNNPVPIAMYGQSELEICQNDCIDFTNTSTIHPSDSIVSYQWIVGGQFSTDTNPTFCFPTPGVLNGQLIVTSSRGCADTIRNLNSIVVYVLPQAGFESFLIDDENTSTKVQIQDQSYFGDYYTYYFGDGDSSSLQNPQHIYYDSGFYDVTQIVTNTFGCADTLIKTINVQLLTVYVPNTFTPDGDGLNEFLVPILNGDDPDAYLFRVFDRWGELIFQTQIKDDGWDGTYKGENCKTDTYVWTLKTKYRDADREFFFRGHVNLLR